MHSMHVIDTGFVDTKAWKANDMTGPAILNTRVLLPTIVLIALSGAGLWAVLHSGPPERSIQSIAVNVYVHNITIDPGLPRAYVSGIALGSLTSPTSIGAIGVIDTRTSRLVRTILVGSSPGSMAIAPRIGRVFITDPGFNYSGHAVDVVDAHSGKVIRVATVGTYPDALAVDEQTMKVFVANVLSNTVSVLDARSGALLHTIPVGQAPTAVTVDAQTRRVFVSNQDGKSVSVLDALTGTVVRTVAVGPNWPRPAVVDARHNWVIISTQPLNGGPGKVFVLNARSGLTQRVFPLRANSYVAAMDEASGHALVLTEPTSQAAGCGSPGASVSLLSPLQGTILHTTAIAPDMPQGQALAIDASHSHVFVFALCTVSMLDSRDGKLVRIVSVGHGGLLAGAVDDVRGQVLVGGCTSAPQSIFDTLGAWLQGLFSQVRKRFRFPSVSCRVYLLNARTL